MNRRFFLRSAAGLVLAAPFLPSRERVATAEPARPPRRSVIFHSPCGCVTTRWFPKVEDGPLDANALKGTSLEALAPFVRKLLVPRGLRALNSYARPQTVDPHDQAMASKLTCALLDATSRDHYALSHSLDHEMARQINPGGAKPLVVSVGMASSNVKLLLSYSAPLTPFPATVNPQNVYSGLGAVLGTPGAELEYVRRRRKSVLDAVSDDLQSYQRLDMSRNDRHRVDAWLDLVREAERAATETNTTTSRCTEQSVGVDAASVNAISQSASIADAFTLGADTMIKLIALNMLCDANRSFVLSFPGYVTFDWDGIHHTYDHDALAHRNGSFSVGGTCIDRVLEMLTEIDAWYAAKFAKLVALLDSLPEADGSVLDNSAATWLQEFSDGNAQNLNNMPIVIAGSAGGYLRQGVAVNVEGSPIGPGNSEASCGPGSDGTISINTGSVGGNVPINKLYVTLLNAVGCKASNGGPVTSFGVFDGFEAEEGITDPGELGALEA